MEAIAVIDVLRRGGVVLETVAIGARKEVKGTHGVAVVADRTLEEVKGEEAECLVFPGGLPGAQHLGDCAPLIEMMRRQYDEGRYLAAICAAPALVLGKLNARPLRLTCYPGCEQSLPAGIEVSSEPVVVDGKVVSGKGPGFAVPFALELLAQLRTREIADEVAAGMLLK